MSDNSPAANVPVAGSLEARIIRACTVHASCELTCKERGVEDLGQIASFDVRARTNRDWRAKFKHWMQQLSQPQEGEEP